MARGYSSYGAGRGRGRGRGRGGGARGPERGARGAPSKQPNHLSTATHLVIVESPSKCPKISEYLGAQFHCIASKGHIRELISLTNAYSPKPGFQPKYTLCPDKIEHIENMQQIIARFPPSNVILATDDDREGEAIAWHICQVFGLPVETTHRIIFHSITYEALLDAIQHPRIIDMNVVHAQQTRQILDVIVGFKISPFLWRHVGNPSKTQSLSAGRCQTPALRLVYDAHLIAQKENPQEKGRYKLRAYFFAPNLEFSTDTTFSTAQQTQQFLEASLPENSHHLLPLSKPKDYQQAPPTPFHTSHLLQVANSKLGLSPKMTMALCQQLYQEGHITYMRTDSKTYSPEFQAQAQDFIKQHYGASYTIPLSESSIAPEKQPNTKKTTKKEEKKGGVQAQEAHEAIRPTHIETMGRLSSGGKQEGEEEEPSTRGKKEALYQLIWRNTIESCMPACHGKRTKVQIQGPPIPDENNETKKEDNKVKGTVDFIIYSHDIEVPHFPGWKRVHLLSESEFRQLREKQEGLVAYVTHLHPETPLVPNRIEAEYTEPRPPFYYTEASLIEKLESMGIGRPSTFAMLVETIQDRGYVKKQDLEGRTMVCRDFVCIPPKNHSTAPPSTTIQVIEKQKKFGAQKGKLVIQPLGISVLDFLLAIYSRLFDYGYTSQMESHLDEMARGEKAIGILERECYQEIKTLSQPLLEKEKETYSLLGNEEYHVVFGKSGPVVFRLVPEDLQGVPEETQEEIPEEIPEPPPKKRGRKSKSQEGEESQQDTSNTEKKTKGKKGDKPKPPPKIKFTKEYLPMKKNLVLDKEKLARGEYTLEELVEWTDPVMGIHEGESMILKTGKFGTYVEWGEKRESIAPLIEQRKKLGLDTSSLEISDIVTFLREKESNGGAVVDGKKILRVFTPEISVRMGRFGPYVYYLPSTAPPNTKPQFLSLKKLDVGYMVCTKTQFLKWLSDTHGVDGIKS
jgi:DNA topoisomerase-1